MEDLKLVRTLLEQLRQGAKPCSARSQTPRGSVPRGPGARMAVLSDGVSLGTVGGGAVELQAQQDARTVLTDGTGSGPRIYDLGAGGQTGMVCGGVVTICFTQIDAGARADLGKWAELLESRRPGVLLLGPDGLPAGVGAGRASGHPARMRPSTGRTSAGKGWSTSSARAMWAGRWCRC